MLSEKYVAGFLDSDGNISLMWPKSCSRPQLKVMFSQKTSNDKVLHLIQEAYGGGFRIQTINGVEYSEINLCGSTARKCLERIKKHLVIKRNYAEECLALANTVVVDKEKEKARLKAVRRSLSLPLPNFPSRKWLAGYFDGDGCVSAVAAGVNGNGAIRAHIACSWYDTEGITIIHKNFGGVIGDMRKGECRQWYMSVSPSKAKQFLSYFGQYSIVKKSQIDFILGCAEMGHYRDGKSIVATLKQLKAQEHRLSDPEVGVAALVANVTDKPRPWKKSGGIERCIICGGTHFKHASQGRCKRCFALEYQPMHKERQSMRQSEAQA